MTYKPNTPGLTITKNVEGEKKATLDTNCNQEGNVQRLDVSPSHPNDGLLNKGHNEISPSTPPPVTYTYRKVHNGIVYNSYWSYIKATNPVKFQQLLERRNAYHNRPDVKAKARELQWRNNRTEHRKQWMAEYMRQYRAKKRAEREDGGI